MKLFYEILLYLLSYLIPKKKRIALGAWNGKKYADNPAYLAEDLHRYSDYDLYWVGEEKIKNQVPNYIHFLDIKDRKTKWKLMTMEYAFVSHSHADLCQYNVFANTTLILMWHGVGIKALKNLQSESKIRSLLRRFLRKYDYFLASSEANKERMLNLFADYGANDDNILLTGQTRVKFFHKEKNNRQNFKEQLYPSLKDKQWIVYMPTFRESSEKEFSFLSLNKDQSQELDTLLNQHNAVLLEKRHPSSQLEKNIEKESVFDLSKETVETQSLLLAADLLVTDYSSVAFDFLLLDRPIVYFIYDLENYLQGSSGLYYHFDDIQAGSSADQLNSLLRKIDQSLSNPNKEQERRKMIYDTMLKYDDGKASERIMKYFNLKKRRD